MDFSLIDEQPARRDETVRFVRSELNEDVIQRDAESAFSAEVPASFGTIGSIARLVEEKRHG
jgi:hypothetical protein